MKAISKSRLWAGLAVLLVCAVGSVMAQDRGNRQRGDRQRPDFSQFQEMMMERMKEDLGATDDEWKAIGPLVEDVMEKQRATRGSPFGGRGFGGRGAGRGQGAEGGRGNRGNRGNRGGGPGDENPEADALQEVLEAKDAPASDIQTKLKAYRNARQKKAAELKEAQENLRKVLTLRQEATLVLRGMME